MYIGDPPPLLHHHPYHFYADEEINAAYDSTGGAVYEVQRAAVCTCRPRVLGN